MSHHDFNAIDDDPISLHTQPLGNESGLGTFHTVQPEDVAPSNTPKIVGALVVALMVGAAGVGIYATSGSSSHPRPIVTASNASAPLPAAQAAAAPEQSAQATKAAKAATTDPNSLRAALVKTPSSAATDNVPAPVKTASTKPARGHAATHTAAASARMSADSNQASQAPAEQPLVTPAAPVRSPSDVATTNNQSSVSVPSDAATASDIPAPQEQPAPAQPSPAQ